MKTVVAAQCDNDAAKTIRFDLQRFAEGEQPPAEPPANEPPTDPPAPGQPETPPQNQPPADPANNPSPAAAPQIDAGAFVLPEGMVMDQEMLQEFLPIAQAHGMTQEQAQELVALQAKAATNWVKQLHAHRDAEYAKLMDGIKADPQLGGQEFEQNLGRINAVMDKFGGEGTGDTVHQALAQLAAADPDKARSLYAALDKMSRAASVDGKVIIGSPKPQEAPRYPGLPGRRK